VAAERTDLENPPRALREGQQMQQLALTRRHLNRGQPCGRTGRERRLERRNGGDQLSLEVGLDRGPGLIAHAHSPFRSAASPRATTGSRPPPLFGPANRAARAAERSGPAAPPGAMRRTARGPGAQALAEALGAREKSQAPQGPETFRKCALRATTGSDYASLTLAATPTAALFQRCAPSC